MTTPSESNIFEKYGFQLLDHPSHPLLASAVLLIHWRTSSTELQLFSAPGSTPLEIQCGELHLITFLSSQADAIGPRPISAMA